MQHEPKKELDHLRALLKLEKEADLQQYKELVERLPLAERKEKGLTWHPVQVSKSGYTYGDRAFIQIEKENNRNEPHQFRAGKTVRFFTDHPGARQPEKAGVINFVDRNRMRIILNSRDLPEWLGIGPFGVDLLFDDRPYVEMDKALVKVIEAKKGRLAELRSILLGNQHPAFYPVENKIDIPELNESQNQAVNQILASRDVAVIHGPPGTGKTTTLVQAIRILAQREHTVLVTAPSNTAVDLLTERLVDLGLNVVRVGNISRVDEKIISHTLEGIISQHPETKNIKKVRIQAAEARRQAKRFRRKYGREQYLERRNLFKEAGELEGWAKQLEDRLIDQTLSGAQVITCTLIGANNKVLEKRSFKTVVIDEAAQALEPATWIPICKASKVVLAGDPFQLPPTVKSMEAQRGGLNRTMIERCIEKWSDVSLLNVQYRMHNAIMGFSNQQFYQGILRAAEEVKRHQLTGLDHPPVTFIDTAGCGFEEKINPEFQSRYNPEEFHILCEHLYQLSDGMKKNGMPEIALISPYREQVIHMENIAREDDRLAAMPLVINTIDGFQGQEKDVVYISLVRSNLKGTIGFLKDYRRMNVAMTRARKWLIVVGDSATIGQHDFYKDFLDYVEKHGVYVTAWEYMQ